jgi:hypothetical protein
MIAVADPAGSGVDASRGLVEGSSVLAALDVASLSDAELVGLLDDVEVAQRRVDAVRCAAAAEIDVRGVAPAWFGHVTSVFMATRYGWSRGRAKTCLATGRRLAQLDSVRAALVEGRITIEHADVICRSTNLRVLDVVAGCQDELVALADGVRFERFSREVRALLRHADTDGGDDPRHEPRSWLRLRHGSDGELLLDGVMMGADAPLVREMLERSTDAVFRRESAAADSAGDAPRMTSSERRAEALVDLLRRGHAADPTAGRGPVVDVTLVVHADGGSATDGAGEPLPDHVVEQFMCDPVLHPLVLDGAGAPLWLGHGVRFASRDQRRAAAVRDGGCVFPGCDAPPAWVDLHHVVRVADGGATDMSNLASLCRRHHGVVHSRRWTMTTTDDQWFEFTAPNGARLPSQRHGRSRHGPPLE